MIQNIADNQSLMKQQHEIQEKAQTILGLISMTIVNYLDLNQKSFVKEIKENLKPESLIRIPKLSNENDIFKVCQRSISIKNEEIIIKLEIPLVQNYSRVDIVSIPDQQREIHAPTDQSKQTNQYIQMEQTEQVYESIYQHINFMSMPECLINITYFNNSKGCKTATLDKFLDQISPVSDTNLLILNDKSNSSIKCNNQETKLRESFYIATLPANCTIYTYSKNITTGSTLSIKKNYSLNLSQIDLLPPNVVNIQDTEVTDIVDKQIETLKNALYTVIGSNSNLNNIWICGLICILCITGIFLIIKCIPKYFMILESVNNTQVTN